MPDFLRKFIGLLLIFAAVGVASCQALLTSCAPATSAISTAQPR
jgi:hypothetical protein